PTPTPTPNVGPVYAADHMIILNAAPAGMKTIVQDKGNGYVDVYCQLKGLMNINSFSWSLQYDRSKVIPVKIANLNIDAPNSKLANSTDVSPYYELRQPERLQGYNIASFQLENTSNATYGNYVLLAFAKYTGTTIAIESGLPVTFLKMTFRKLAPIDASTFNYFHKVAAGTAVSKMIYGTTSVLQYPTNVGTTYFTRPDLFAFDFSGNHISQTISSSSAADLMTTGDAVYDEYMNLHAATTVSVKNSYLSTQIIDSTKIDPISKSAYFSTLLDGSYLFAISRPGYLTRDISVLVAGTSANLGEKLMIPGDVFSDGIIDGSDSELLFSTVGLGYGDSGFNCQYDLSFDGIIDGTDSEMLFANIGKDASIYGENVNYYN
ncbi:MAG: hypothetical protein WCL54_01105, partial [Clostridia bacterium]